MKQQRNSYVQGDQAISAHSIFKNAHAIAVLRNSKSKTPKNAQSCLNPASHEHNEATEITRRRSSDPAQVDTVLDKLSPTRVFMKFTPLKTRLPPIPF